MEKAVASAPERTLSLEWNSLTVFSLDFPAGRTVYNTGMNSHEPSPLNRLARRPSALSELLAHEKLAEARRMSPEERLLLALELSDTCLELQRMCSPKL